MQTTTATRALRTLRTAGLAYWAAVAVENEITQYRHMWGTRVARDAARVRSNARRAYEQATETARRAGATDTEVSAIRRAARCTAHEEA